MQRPSLSPPALYTHVPFHEENLRVAEAEALRAEESLMTRFAHEAGAPMPPADANASPSLSLRRPSALLRQRAAAVQRQKAGLPPLRFDSNALADRIADVAGGAAASQDAEVGSDGDEDTDTDNETMGELFSLLFSSSGKGSAAEAAVPARTSLSMSPPAPPLPPRRNSARFRMLAFGSLDESEEERERAAASSAGAAPGAAPRAATATADDRRLPPGARQPDGSIFVFGYGSLTWKVDFVIDAERSFVARLSGGWRRRFYQASADHRGTPEKPGLVVTMVRGEVDAQTAAWELSDATNRKSAAADADDDADDAWGVLGVAFNIPAEHVDATVAALDEREKGGYSTQTATVRVAAPLPLEFANAATARGGGRCEHDPRCASHPPRDSDSDATSTECGVVVMLYIGTEKNENYRGPAPLRTVASTIAAAEGPSGQNSEYLYGLHDAMEILAPLCPPQGAARGGGSSGVEPYLAELTREVRRIETAAAERK